MQHVGTSKIGKLSAKGIEYPQLRLPKQYSGTIGKTAEIYETEHDGKRAFLVVTEECMSDEGMVLKLRHEVLKLHTKKSTDSRISALESEINELEILLLLNEGSSPHKKAKTDGLEAIRTPDLRRVKAKV